jgi:hypothetical protein
VASETGRGAVTCHSLRSVASGASSLTVRVCPFIVVLIRPRASACSTKIVRLRTLPHVRARVSLGRNPAYARTETNTASRIRPRASRILLICSTCAGVTGRTTRSRRCEGLRTALHGSLYPAPLDCSLEDALEDRENSARVSAERPQSVWQRLEVQALCLDRERTQQRLARRPPPPGAGGRLSPMSARIELAEKPPAQPAMSGQGLESTPHA